MLATLAMRCGLSHCLRTFVSVVCVLQGGIGKPNARGLARISPEHFCWLAPASHGSTSPTSLLRQHGRVLVHDTTNMANTAVCSVGGRKPSRSEEVTNAGVGSWVVLNPLRCGHGTLNFEQKRIVWVLVGHNQAAFSIQGPQSSRQTSYIEGSAWCLPVLPFFFPAGLFTDYVKYTGTGFFP